MILSNQTKKKTNKQSNIHTNTITCSAHVSFILLRFSQLFYVNFAPFSVFQRKTNVLPSKKQIKIETREMYKQLIVVVLQRNKICMWQRRLTLIQSVCEHFLIFFFLVSEKFPVRAPRNIFFPFCYCSFKKLTISSEIRSKSINLFNETKKYAYWLTLLPDTVVCIRKFHAYLIRKEVFIVFFCSFVIFVCRSQKINMTLSCTTACRTKYVESIYFKIHPLYNIFHGIHLHDSVS